jgi:hypothetical protein
MWLRRSARWILRRLLTLAGILDIPAAKCSSAPADLDHGVAIVGYGTEGSIDY